MCGISGIVSDSICDLDKKLVRQATDSLSHRGPDFSRVMSDKNYSFGHARLSIIDLSSKANQPLVSANNNVSLIFNGEIYNYLEIKANLRNIGYSFKSESDTEVILGAYLSWGIQFISRLRGMFAIAIWDNTEGKLYLIRDIFGERPLYYKFSGNSLKFSSEMKSMLKLCPIDNSLNFSAIDLFLHYQFIPEPQTLISGIFKVPPGSYLEFSPSSGHLQFHSYCKPFNLEISDIMKSEEEYVLEIKKRFKEAVKRTLVADVPIAIALSGGIDSGAIAAVAVEIGAELTAFTVGYPGRPAFDERGQAIELASALGIKVYEIEIPINDFVKDFPSLVRILDDPIADPAAYAHLMIPKYANKLGFKVMLSGIGGDELFWGYSWLSNSVKSNMLRIKKKNSKFKILIRKNKLKVLTPENLLYFYEELPDFMSPFKHKDKFYGDAMTYLKQNDIFSVAGTHSENERIIPTRIIQALCGTWLSGNCLALADRVGMAYSVETRMPFLDYDFVKLIIANQETYPSYNLNSKYYLKQSLKTTLDSKILHRPKSGFRPPTSEWLDSVITKYSSLLKNGILLEEKVITKSGVEYLLDGVATKNWDMVFLVYKLIILEIWLREFYL